MKEKIIKFFKDFTLFDILFLSISMPITIAFSIIFKSPVFNAIYSVFSIIAIFLLTKGLFFVPLLLMITYTMYTVITYQNGFFGETIIYSVLLIPLQLITFISWFVKRKKQGKKFVIEKIEKKEWAILLSIALVVGVGMFFLLRAFKTNYLVLSTIIFTTTIISNYLSLRKTEYSFIGFLINNGLIIIMWLMPLFEGKPAGLELVSMAVTTATYIVLNMRGFLSWRKMRKAQNCKNNIEMIENVEKNEEKH